MFPSVIECMLYQQDTLYYKKEDYISYLFSSSTSVDDDDDDDNNNNNNNDDGDHDVPSSVINENKALLPTRGPAHVAAAASSTSSSPAPDVAVDNDCTSNNNDFSIRYRPSDTTTTSSSNISSGSKTTTSLDDTPSSSSSSSSSSNNSSSSCCATSNHHHPNNHHCRDDDPSNNKNNKKKNTTTIMNNIYADRRVMILWCYQIFDYCKFQRENVEIVLSYVDRYIYNKSLLVVGTSSSSSSSSSSSVIMKQLLEPKTYQLIIITCVYTVIKLHESHAMHPKTMSKLSRWLYTEKMIQDMELDILCTLQWKLNPPSSLSFVRILIDMINTIPYNNNKNYNNNNDNNNNEDIPIISLTDSMKQDIYDICKIQMEIILVDPNYLLTKPSIIAYCSIMNALEIILLQNTTVLVVECPTETLIIIGSYYATILRINCNHPNILHTQDFLYTSLCNRNIKQQYQQQQRKQQQQQQQHHHHQQQQQQQQQVQHRVQEQGRQLPQPINNTPFSHYQQHQQQQVHIAKTSTTTSTSATNTPIVLQDTNTYITNTSVDQFLLVEQRIQPVETSNPDQLYGSEESSSVHGNLLSSYEYDDNDRNTMNRRRDIVKNGGNDIDSSLNSDNNNNNNPAHIVESEMKDNEGVRTATNEGQGQHHHHQQHQQRRLSLIDRISPRCIFQYKQNSSTSSINPSNINSSAE